MRKLTLVLGLLLAALLSGCSTDQPTAPADTATIDGAQFQRPEFIDERPEAVQQQFTLTEADVFTVTPASPDKAGAKYALAIGRNDLYPGMAGIIILELSIAGTARRTVRLILAIHDHSIM